MKIVKPQLIHRIFIFLFLVCLSAAISAATGTISTQYGHLFLGEPVDVAFDSNGNTYIASRTNHRVIKVTPAGRDSNFAGTGTTRGPVGDGGPAANAYLDPVRGLHIDSNDNVYIATGSRIRIVDTSGIINTIAGTGASVQFISPDGDNAKSTAIHPTGVTTDDLGNIYFTESDFSSVRKILPNGTVKTIAGGKDGFSGYSGFSGDGGPASAAKLHWPHDIKLDSKNNIYVADYANSRVRKITTNGVISTYASFGGNVRGVAIDDVDNLYVSVGVDDNFTTEVVKVDLSLNETRLVSNLRGFSGDGGPSTAAQIGSRVGLGINAAGDLFLADIDNLNIRKIEGAAIVNSNFYRLFNPYSGEHLFTRSKDEYDQLGPLGWIQENVAFKGLSGPGEVNGVTAKPWLRLFNPNSGLHHWTLDHGEYDALATLGWKQEGPTGYIFEEDMTGLAPLFRLYNPNDGNHHWTMDSFEKDVLSSIGWKFEGIAGYVYPTNTSSAGS